MAKRDKTRTPETGGPSSQIQSLARDYALQALDMLFALAKEAESEAVRVSAIKELLDRGLGKSGAPGADPDAPILTRIERLIVDSKN